MLKEIIIDNRGINRVSVELPEQDDVSDGLVEITIGDSEVAMCALIEPQDIVRAYKALKDA